MDIFLQAVDLFRLRVCHFNMMGTDEHDTFLGPHNAKGLNTVV